MLVSINALSLMQFIPAGSNYAAQVKTLVEQRHGLPLRASVGFFLAHEDLNLTSQQAANGGRTPGSEDLGQPDGLPIKADGQVLLLFFLTLWICHKLLQPSLHVLYVYHVYYV